MEDKEDKIIEELKEEVRSLKNGIITVEFKIHDSKIALGEVINSKKRLG